MEEPRRPDDFSLLGGPLHRLGCRLGLVRGGTHTVRLGLALGVVPWLILMGLALIEGAGQQIVSPSVIGVRSCAAAASAKLTPSGISVQREAMPMIRYRTRDITTLRRERCECGRTLIKMDKVYGRSDDMLIISGVNVFPSQIESLLLEIPEVEPQYRLVVRKKGYLDQLIVQVEAKKEVYDAGPAKRLEIAAKVMAQIKGMMGIGVDVELVEAKFINRSEGKALRVVDERPKQLR